MASAARGASYALLSLGFVLVAAGLAFYSLDLLLAPPIDTRANAQILLAQGIGSALLAGIGLVALVVGIVLFMVTGRRDETAKPPAKPAETIR